MTWLVLIAAMAVPGLAAFGWGRWRFARRVAGIEAVLGATPAARPRDDLPAEVEAYARRALMGQPPARLIRLHQRAEMELKRGAGWKPLAAEQTIAASTAGFAWLAHQGPVTVLDSYAAGRGLLEVRLLRGLRLARAEGPQIDRAEAMRYLAELPWCPDAILLNHALGWTVLDSGRWRVRLGAAEVTFTLEEGEIRRMEASGRPALEGGQTVLRDWRGIYDGYKVIGPDRGGSDGGGGAVAGVGAGVGRRIPGRGQVGYVIEGDFAPYFIGHIEGLSAVL